MGTLTISYEGYWQCRQATDPDPSDDRRGASGYTFAFGNENDLDMVIRLQKDDIPPVDFRAAPPPYYPPTNLAKTFGVFVTGVVFDGSPFPAGQDILAQAKVRWLPAKSWERDPKTGLVPGPKFELRNTITYFPVGNGIFMPIVPFHIEIEGNGLTIGRDDPLDPQHPERRIWEMDDVHEYSRRCPVEFTSVSDEAMESIGVTSGSPGDPGDFFQKRKEWVQMQLTQSTLTEVEREALTNRLFQLDNNNRFETRLGLKATWDFDLTGRQVTLTGADKLGGTIDPEPPWRVRFWMGAFDGDLLRGYMRGSLSVPFRLRG